MPLSRASAQGGDLHQFYQQLAAVEPEDGWSEVSRHMLELLPLLEELCADLPVWGLTSHAA